MTLPGVLTFIFVIALCNTSNGKTLEQPCRQPGIEYPIGIDFDEVKQGLEDETLLLIDVRNRSELVQDGEIPRSVNLPLPEIQTAFNELTNEEFQTKYNFLRPVPSQKNVVLTCRSGRRVLVAWKALEPLGYCNIRIYFGSLLDWKRNNGPLV